ncbi:hypothetical protein DRQ05_00365 [bacterium]|nr:MAG: hypothetical protein DRQ05_00365 [bacterium]
MFRELLYRETYLIPIFCGVIIQSVKVLLYSLIEKRYVLEKFTQPDGMPNLHAGVFSSLSTMIGIKYGVGSILFSVVTTYSAIIIHDTLRLKGEKGKQVEVLNKILDNVDEYSELRAHASLKVLRYKPLDVLSGVLIGILSTGLFM